MGRDDATTHAQTDSLPRRVAVTLAACAALIGGERLPLHQIDPQTFRDFAPLGYGGDLSPLALGITPFIIAFVLVEFVAAAVPRWRPLRHGTTAERARLTRAAWWLAVGVAAYQGWRQAVWLSHVTDLRGDPIILPGWESVASVAATFVLGTLAAGALAVLISRKGLGNGFAVLLGAWSVEALGWAGLRAMVGPSPEWSDRGALTVLALAVVVALVAVRRRRERGADHPRVPLPTCSLTVLDLPGGVLELFSTAIFLCAAEPERTFGALLPMQVRAWGWFALVILLAVPLSRLFFPSGAVVECYRRAAAPGASDVGPGVLRSLRIANWSSLALVAGLAGLPSIGAWLGAGYLPDRVTIVALITAVAVGADLGAEWRARRGGRARVAIRPLHQAWAVQPVLRALASAGIEGHARARHFRALFHLFAPYAPVEILVPPERAAEADAICARVVVATPI